MRQILQRLFVVCCAWMAPTLASSDAAATEPIRFKLLVSEAGIYRVTFEDLVAAGLPAESTEEGVRLTNRASAVPIWRRGGSGPLAAGDALIFRAERLHGKHSFLHDHSRLNVYVLEIGGDAGLEMQSTPATDAAATSSPLRLGSVVHRERDLLLHRFSRRPDDPPSEDWFWRRLTQIDREPFSLKLDLRDLDPSEPLTLRLAFRGWSTPRGGKNGTESDHVVDISLNGVSIGQTAWNAQEVHVVEIDPVVAEAVRAEVSTLELSVPKRTPAGAADPLIDVVLLNWVEIEHGRRGSIRRGQEALRRSPEAGRAVLEAAAGADLLVFTDDGEVYAAAADGDRRVVDLNPDPSPPFELQVVRNEAFHSPEHIVRDRPSDLRTTRRQADYLMIAHPSLMAAIEPLADFHRRRGLRVEVIDVFDAYDEFSHGIIEPHAIRDLIAHAHGAWQAPAPRFVLLVGDASWDSKNPKPRSRNYVDWTYRPGEVQRTPRNQLTPYEEGSELDRNLIPTWKFYGAQGHAASDNYFVAVEGDDFLPDLAIGRFPVVEPEEVATIVDKTIRYATESAVGPWRRNLLWIANESRAFQRQSDAMAAATGAQGFTNTKIYPSPEEADNVGHQQTLLESLNEGQLLVHFIGHGGRYIWRTGPPDFRKNHDLFTLEHLDQLAPSGRLPIILSMTCYSAPFDHPTADSIGEKFLRLADRGAAAILAASWRNSPGSQLSQRALTSLLAGATVGEAVLDAKRGLARRDLIETYNLLGDPAIALPAPQERLAIERVEAGGATTVRVQSTSGNPLAGQLLIDWLGEGNSILLSERHEATGKAVELAYPEGAEGSPVGVSAYLWDEESGRDGLGALDLLPEAPQKVDIGEAGTVQEQP